MIQEIALYFFRNGSKILIGAGFVYILSAQNFEFKIGNQQNGPKREMVSLTNHQLNTSFDQVNEWKLAENFLEQWNRFEYFLRKQLTFDGKHLLDIPPEQINLYIRKFQRLAITEQRRSGIPASVIIAHGLLQSKAGLAIFSQQSNNHFGLPCSEDWLGSRAMFDNECFRNYDSPAISYQDNTFYLTTGRQQLYTQSIKKLDYKAWAKAISNIELYQEKNYEQKLVKLIEDLELYKLDEIVL